MRNVIILFAALFAMTSCGGGATQKQDDSTEADIIKIGHDIAPYTRGVYDADADWIVHLNSLKNNLSQEAPIDVYFKHCSPIGNYEVTMLWQPFDKMYETGVAVVNFRDTATNRNYYIVSSDKYTNYYLCNICFAQGFEGYSDDDVFLLDGAVPEQPEWCESSINYYMPFQFFDADFDGKDELLVSDWGQCQQGNTYSVYDITDEDFVLKAEVPFNNIDNTTKFDADKKCIEISSHDGIFMSMSSIYNVSSASAELIKEYVFTLHMVDGIEDWYDVMLTIFDHGELCFEGLVGRVQNLSYEVENFYPEVKAGVVRAPYEPLFFADIDFDGTDELITNLQPYAGSQRDNSAYTSIYKLVDGKYCDVSESYAAKCEVLSDIEPYYFLLNYARKEVIYYCDGGVMCSGWRVYAYRDGEYIYDRYVHYECEHDGDIVVVSVEDANGVETLRSSVSVAEFERRQWEY